MAAYQVSPPEQFDFSRPNDWPKWVRRFERFRCASGLTDKAEKLQVHTLIYSMGDAADNILKSFNLTEEEQKTYTTVKEKFDNHFIKKRNVTQEKRYIKAGLFIRRMLTEFTVCAILTRSSLGYLNDARLDTY